MSANNILALSIRICHGQPVRIPPLNPAQWGILLNHIAANREEMHGAAL